MNPKRWEEEIDYGLINYLFKTRRGPSKELLSLSFSLLNLFSWLMHGFCAVVSEQSAVGATLMGLGAHQRTPK